MARPTFGPVGLAMAVVLLVGGAAPVVAQDDLFEWVQERCAAYGSQPPVPEGIAAGSRLFDCTLESVPAAEVAGGTLGPLFDRLDIEQLQRVEDPADDLFSLTTGEVAPGDPATDLLAAYLANVKLPRSDAREVERFLDRQAPEGWTVVLGDKAQQTLSAKDGFQVFVVETAGDPTTRPDATRSFQLAFMGTGPTKSLPSMIPTGSPLMGARWGATYGQFVSEQGVQDFFAATDFSGKPLKGSDTVFYNLGGRGAAIAIPEGIVIIVPSSLDPRAFRPAAFDTGNGLVDIMGVGSPYGYVPSDGTGAGLLEWLTLALVHQSLPDQTFTVDGALQEGQPLPSFTMTPFGSRTYPLILPPPPVTWGYEVDGRTFGFEGIVPDPLGGRDYLFETGIPSYGTYCLDDFRFQVRDDMRWSDGEQISPADIEYLLANLTEEARNVLGTWCWIVTETTGVLGSPGYEASWTVDPTTGPRAWVTNPETAAVLEQAGWLPGPDGLTFDPPEPPPATQ